MAKVEKPRLWVNDDWFHEADPRSTVIRAVHQEPGKYGTDVILEFDLGTCFTVFGQNLRTLIDKLGDEDSKWIGRKVSLGRDGTKKVLRVL